MAKAKPEKLNSNLSSISGEYLVAGKLSSMGYIVTLTRKNTDNIDILVANKDATKTACIQVKTSQQKRNIWVLGEKNEVLKSKYLYYVFVRLNNDNPPDFYIVKSAEVAEAVLKRNKEFLAGGGVENKFREFSPTDKSKDNWKILGL